MNANEVAAHYIKYWYQDHEGNWRIADNAPTQLQLCVRSLPKHVDMDMLHRVFTCMVSKTPIQAPDMPALLKWLSSSADATRRCDEILQHPAKNKCATLVALLAKAWSTAAYSTLDRVHRYFST